MMLPPVPETVAVNVLVGDESGAETVRITVLLEPGVKETRLEESELVGPPLGATLEVSETGPEYPPVLATTIWVVTESPWNTVWLFGKAVIEKSGGPLAKVPICALSPLTVPSFWKTKTHVWLPKTLDAQPALDGNVMSVVPVPTIL